MDLISRILLGVASFAGALCSRQAADELKAWTPWLSDWLIKRAARRFPNDEDRLIEEWRGRLHFIPGEVGKIVFSVSLQFDADNWKQKLAERAIALLVVLVFMPMIIFCIGLLLWERDKIIFRKYQVRNQIRYRLTNHTFVGRFARRRGLERFPALLSIVWHGDDGNLLENIREAQRFVTVLLRLLR